MSRRPARFSALAVAELSCPASMISCRRRARGGGERNRYSRSVWACLHDVHYVRNRHLDSILDQFVLDFFRQKTQPRQLADSGVHVHDLVLPLPGSMFPVLPSVLLDNQSLVPGPATKTEWCVHLTGSHPGNPGGLDMAPKNYLIATTRTYSDRSSESPPDRGVPVFSSLTPVPNLFH